MVLRIASGRLEAPLSLSKIETSHLFWSFGRAAIRIVELSARVVLKLSLKIEASRDKFV